VSEGVTRSGSPFQAIRAIDYTVVIVRDMTAMRRFYENILGFRARGEPLPDWVEYSVGDNTLALTKPRRRAGSGPTATRGASLQLAFKVSVAEVDQCADELVRQGIKLVSPPTDQAPGRRTMFFRDPDGNLLEMFGDI
jgi:catechol 2,3-dioxygenase-like lactoylglutathione lyase family enzyme